MHFEQKSKLPRGCQVVFDVSTLTRRYKLLQRACIGAFCGLRSLLPLIFFQRTSLCQKVISIIHEAVAFFKDTLRFLRLGVSLKGVYLPHLIARISYEIIMLFYNVTHIQICMQKHIVLYIKFLECHFRIQLYCKENSLTILSAKFYMFNKEIVEIQWKK